MLLGVDVGTTNLKVVAYSPEQGTIVGAARRPTRTHRPRPGWAELDPDELWSETVAALREVTTTLDPDAIHGIAIGSMGESGVLLDDHLRPVAPIIAWYDRRTEEQATWWRSVIDPWAVYTVTGLILDSKFSANHMLWLRQHHPEQFAAARHWLCLPDFLAWKLCGEQVIDYSLASRTMLFDQRRTDWSDELLERCGLPRSLLPAAAPGGTRVGGVSSTAAAESGLPAGCAVVTGGHDHLVGALGAGVVHPGSVLDSTGTAEAVLQLTDAFRPDRALFEAGLETYAFVLPRTFAIVSAINLAGGAVEWLIRLLWGEADAASELALAAAEAAPPGSAGVIWLPHLLGSGTPHTDPTSRGAVVGLRPEHDRGHITRGLLEGLAYWLRENLELVHADTTIRDQCEIVVIGGATRSSFWTQLKADVTGRVLRAPELEEAVALGSALLAGIGAGVFANADQAVASVRTARREYAPRPEITRLYDRWYTDLYQHLYPALREANTRIERLSSNA